jgi:ABC-2 type transport system ATP-binding protein
MIRIDGLSKSYGSIRAVAGISFEVAAGETFGLVGPNGAGKSTTIGIMVGVLKPDAGTVTLDGDEDASSSSARKHIGVAPQSLALYEDLTADENLKFFARLYGLAGRALQERVDWAIDFAGLADRRKSLVSTYSGGMKRRLNMAVALVHDPRVVVFDEPTVGIDPQSRNHIFDCIERLKRDGRTIIYTTHYMEEAERLCDRVAIMDQGRLLDLDTVDALIERHGGLSIVEAKLIEPLPPMDDLPGRVDEGVLLIETARPLEDIARLSEAGVRFTTLSVRRPDLEVVFLTLTGRRLRDD